METLKEMTSWLGVFKKTGIYTEIDSIDSLQEYIKENPGCNVSGSFHSYNSRALAGNKTVKLVGENFDFIETNFVSRTAMVGAAVTVEKLMDHLIIAGHRMINSGNYRKQTLVGAILGGTHGFGPNASIADSVVSFVYMTAGGEIKKSDRISDMPKKKAILGVTIKIEIATAFHVEARQQRLNDIELKPNTRCAFLVLPYTNQKNPMVIETKYRELEHSYYQPAIFSKGKTAWSVPWSAWKLKVFWALDSRFSCFRKLLQRVLNYFNIPSWKLVTKVDDIDSLYHPWPGIDNIKDKPRFGLWAFKPTYTGYNISLFFTEEDFHDAVYEIAYVANEGHRFGYPRNFLFSFVGCRYLSTKSKVNFAGNYNKRVVGVDMYCKPKHAKYLIQLQKELQTSYDTRSHRGKTV